VRRLATTTARSLATTTTDGTHIHWQRVTPRRGVAPDTLPLLLVHGFACGSEDWGSLPRALATKSQREVLTFDNRGVGKSSAPPGPYTVDMLAADALHVLDQAEVPRAHVLGISLGGMIAQTLALAQPERVHGLILGCTTHGGREATPVPEAFISLAAAWVAEETADANESPSVDDFLGWMLPADVVAQPSGAQLLEHLKHYFKQTPRTHAGLQGQLAAMGRFNSTKRLADLARHRCLVVAGTLDEVMPPPNAASLHRRIPGAQLELRDGAGHFFWAHQPAECSAMLARFCDEADADALRRS
jgi:pimeloyl-ACP methyl ester carboxylesterase